MSEGNIPQSAEEYRVWWEERRPGIPYGFCWCDCGRRTKIATRSDRRDLANIVIKGEPQKYIRSHHKLRRGPDYEVDPKTGCWLWAHGTTAAGYGHVNLGGGKWQTAHRQYYERRHGALAPGVSLHHECQVRRCVNPDHLRPMSRSEHVAAHAFSNENHWNARLTNADVRRMRELRRAGVTNKELAANYNISVDHARAVTTGRSRKGID